jgi:hypothetical protein
LERATFSVSVYILLNGMREIISEVSAGEQKLSGWCLWKWLSVVPDFVKTVLKSVRARILLTS